MKIDVETLVNLVVARALVDKTAPDPAILRNGWRADNLLQDIDALVVVSCNSPGIYAEIARQVFAKVQHLPEIAGLAQLAILRGERLLEINPGRERVLFQMMARLQDVISALPDSTRKMRLQSLLNYHKGVFCDACGRFDLAAHMQTISAEEAGQIGDNPGMAIARFCAVLYQLKDALYKGEAEKAKACFSVMERVFFEVVEATRGTALQVQWAEGNCPAHMIEACVWLNQVHPKWNSWVETALTASKILGGAFKSGAEFIRAIDMAHRGDPQADQALSTIIKSNDVPGIKATAILILVRHAMRAGKPELARELVSQMPKQGAQHLYAIACRELSSK